MENLEGICLYIHSGHHPPSAPFRPSHVISSLCILMFVITGLRRLSPSLRPILRLETLKIPSIVNMSGYNEAYVTAKLQKELKTTHLVCLFWCLFIHDIQSDFQC